MSPPVSVIAALLLCLLAACHGGGGGGPIVDAVESVLTVEGLRAELEEITAMGHRMAGTPNEIVARDHVVERFEAIGLDGVRLEPFRYLCWRRGGCSLEVLAPERFAPEARALGFSPKTPDCGLAGEVVYVGTGLEADYAALSPESYVGKIHLVTSSDLTAAHRTVQYISAMLHHAAGFIHMTHREGEGGESLIEIGSTDYFNDIPSIAIDYASGMALRYLLWQGGPMQVRMEVCAHRSYETSWNVVGEIPGASEERVTVGAHYDSWDVGPCAVDNGSGVAALLEIARVAAALGPHERTLRFVSFGAEELGIQGAIAYGLSHAEEIRRLCRLMVNIDILGTTHGSLSITAVSPELKCLVDELIQSTEYSERTGYGARIAEIPALGTDCTPFLILGVPTMSMGKFPFIYYHTEYDTIDKIDWTDLYASTLISAMAALRYADPEPGEALTSVDRRIGS